MSSIHFWTLSVLTMLYNFRYSVEFRNDLSVPVQLLWHASLPPSAPPAMPSQRGILQSVLQPGERHRRLASGMGHTTLWSYAAIHSGDEEETGEENSKEGEKNTLLLEKEEDAAVRQEQLKLPFHTSFPALFVEVAHDQREAVKVTSAELSNKTNSGPSAAVSLHYPGARGREGDEATAGVAVFSGEGQAVRADVGSQMFVVLVDRRRRTTSVSSSLPRELLAPVFIPHCDSGCGVLVLKDPAAKPDDGNCSKLSVLCQESCPLTS